MQDCAHSAHSDIALEPTSSRLRYSAWPFRLKTLSTSDHASRGSWLNTTARLSAHFYYYYPACAWHRHTTETGITIDPNDLEAARNRDDQAGLAAAT